MRYTLVFIALFWAFLSHAQTQPPIVQGAKLYRFVNGIKPDSALFLPRRDTLHTDSAMIAPGQLIYRLADSLLYYRKGNAMTAIAGTGDLSNYYTKPQVDAGFIQNRATPVQTANWFISGSGTARNGLRVDLPTDNNHYQIRTAAGVPMWGMGGINSGFHWSLRNHNDAGVAISSAITVRRDSGYVGLNDTLPTERLHIRGNIRIVDGSQGSGKILSSDSTGVGEWKYPNVLDVESFRYPTYSDWEVIDSAIRYAGPYSIIQLAVDRVYTIDHALIMQDNQELRGYGSTIKRANTAATTLSVAMAGNTNSFTVASVPAAWQIGDQIQLYTDNTNNKSSTVGPAITNITGNVITLDNNIGNSVDGTITTWPIGAAVRTSYSLITTADYNTGGGIVRVSGVRFDGNKANNSENYSWQHNAGIAVRGLGSFIKDCVFYDSPNETITGQGIRVDNCQGYRLNGSFFHVSGLRNYGYSNKHNTITNCTTDSTNQITTTITGHSEGVLTTSFNGGWSTVTGNRFYNGTDAVIGYIAPSNSAVSDDGVQDFIFNNNIARNFSRIVWQLIDAPNFGMTDSVRNVIISDNVFYNCGTSTNNWSSYSTFIGWYPSLKIGDNVLSGGTTWTLPIMPANETYIRNQNTLRWPQNFKIAGNGALDSLNINQATNDNESKLLVNGKGRFYDDITRDMGVALKRNTGDGPYASLTEGQITWGRPVDASTGFGSLLIAPRGNTTSTGIFLFSGSSSTLIERMRIQPNGNVNIGAAGTAVSLLDIRGSVGAAITTVTGNTTLDGTYYMVLVNNSANVTITLPASASNARRLYVIKKVSNNAFTVSIDPNASENIEGTSTPISLGAYLESRSIQCDAATGWWVH